MMKFKFKEITGLFGASSLFRTHPKAAMRLRGNEASSSPELWLALREKSVSGTMLNGAPEGSFKPKSFSLATSRLFCRGLKRLCYFEEGQHLTDGNVDC
jgi:hypothetical protein